MQRSKISLKALEVFLAISRHGSVRKGATELDISISTASHHLSELERSVGTDLFDHSCRPMKLTPAGQVMERRAAEALKSLRLGLSEIWSEDIASLVRHLRVALIEDLDTDAGPALAQALVKNAPHCSFSFLTRPTHEILELLQSEQIDVGVATSADALGQGFIEIPFLRDPFIVVVPEQPGRDRDTDFALPPAQGDLPFLRYSGRQLLGRRIEAQLRRMGAQYPQRLDFEATHLILSLVAAGRGWTITTALSFARAQRYHAQLRAVPFPGSPFSREISIFLRDDVPTAVTQITEATLRHAVSKMILTSSHAQNPWMSDSFHILGAPASIEHAVPLPGRINPQSETVP